MGRLKLSMMCVITLLIFLMPLAANSLYASGEFEEVPISDPVTDETKMSDNPAMYATEEEKNALDVIPWAPDCEGGGMFVEEDPPFATNVEVYDRRTGESAIEEHDTDLEEAIVSLEPLLTEGDPGVSFETITPECVIGVDGRTKIASTDLYPWRVQVKLLVRFGSFWYNCSGTMTNSYQLLTAGHCVHQGSGGSWFDEIRIYPGYECGHKQWWLANSTWVRSYTGWTVDGSANHDWAMLTLDRRIGTHTGWFGRLTADCSWYEGKFFHLSGYPADKDGGECQYYHAEYEQDCDDDKLYYYIDTYGGQSGSGTYYLDGIYRYEVAVHAYGHTSGGACVYNSGTRLNEDKFDRVNTWISEDNSDRPPTDKAELMDDGEVYAGFTPTPVNIGTPFSVWSDIRNVGTTSASNIPVGYYASTNTICTTSDYLIGTAYVPYIGAITPISWEDADWSGDFPTNIPLGTYYLCRIIDPNNNIPEFDDPGAGNANYDSTMLNVIDTIPPSPDPLIWATEPYELNTFQIAMVATTASDPTTPITYYFDFTSSPTGGLGGSDSGWTSTTYTNSGLSTNHQYGYMVRARDGTLNMTEYSGISYDYTDIETPTGIIFGAITAGSIQVRSANTPSNLTSGSSGLYLYNATAGTASGWQQHNNFWTSSPLTPNTAYDFRALTRNGDANETVWSPTANQYTLANAPGVAGFTDITQTSIRANWTANGNPGGTEYYCENITLGTNSGWTTNTNWNSIGLSCGTSYAFQVRAKNAVGEMTVFTPLGSRSTLACDYDPPVIDDIAFDDCISECPTCPDSAITVADHDPEGGILTYDWEALDGGNIIGSGSSVAFDPPDTGPHICPYRVKVTVTSSVSGLSDDATIGIFVKLTGDVDGNGVVNVLDKVQVRNHFGESGSPGWIDADVDCNGVVNVLDKVKVRNQFGDSGCSCPE